MSVTVDASVFVAALRQTEPHYSASQALIDFLDSEETPVFCPTLVLPETATAIARTTGDLSLVADVQARIRSLPGQMLLDLTVDRAASAAEMGSASQLRGADSVYIATAEEFGATLITWDQEMLARAPVSVRAMTPTGWMAARAAVSP